MKKMDKRFMIEYRKINWWKYLTRPFEVIISDMTAFRMKEIYYELTLYFDAWNKEIVGYGLSARKGAITSYYDGLEQVLEKIKKEQTEDVTKLIKDYVYYYNYERPSYALNYKTPMQYKIESGF